MPPALSEDDRSSAAAGSINGDDVDVDMSDGPDEVPAAKPNSKPQTNGRANANGKGKGKAEEPASNAEEEAGSNAEDGSDEEDEEVFVVEKIMKHDWVESGKTFDILYRVMWAGYPNEEDMTWETADNLSSGAEQILEAYHESIGGKPEPPTKAGASKRKSAGGRAKRARDSPEPTQAVEKGKRAKRGSRAAARDSSGEPESTKEEDAAAPAASNGAGSKAVAKFMAASVDWEKKVKYIQSVEKSEDESRNAAKGSMSLNVCLAFDDGTKDGHRMQVKMQTARQRCPQKLLDYYENHLTWRDDEEAQTA